MTTVAKSKNSKTQKSVRIIGRYTFHNGAVVYRVENGEQKQYCCTLHKDGSWTCMGKDDQCPAQKFSKTHTCYHVEHCETHEQEYYRAGVLAEQERITAELVLQRAEQYTSSIQDEDDDSSGDPWEGLDADERYAAWANYELGMSGLA